MKEKKPGFVYILTNPSFREDWIKIGKSSRPVDVRSRELDNTAVPLPFDVYATLQTCKYSEVEQLLHKTIDRLTDLRIRQSREFFNVSPAVALGILQDIALTLDDAVLSVPGQDSVQKEETADSGSRRSPFKFSMIGLKPGDLVVFSPTGLEVKVATDDQVEYEGRLWKLSPFAGTFMPEDLRVPSNAYQGAKFFTFNGEALTDLRERMEGCA
ncbi:MAG: GIY-YIG nuclease family protein [Fibrobacter sp.]|nr:GIY-YIG nuclease family protein [Fibrobacter sp.]